VDAGLTAVRETASVGRPRRRWPIHVGDQAQARTVATDEVEREPGTAPATLDDGAKGDRLPVGRKRRTTEERRHAGRREPNTTRIGALGREQRTGSVGIRNVEEDETTARRADEVGHRRVRFNE